ncbi:MAG: carboxypeptidase-like regulatory domain-containing protein [Bacteroidota bacterium]
MAKYLILILAIASFVAHGQRITLSGRVQDKETREPLVFASVGIKDRPIGTITNLQGEFDFHFAEEYRNDIFAISILGYNTFEAPVWTLLDNPAALVIQMEKKTYVLNEVVVSDTLNGGEILQIALLRVDKNYPSKPFLLDGFYRDVKKVGGTYVSLLEAATKIYDEDYKEPRNKFKLRERVALLEVRRSLGYGNKFTAYFDEDNLLEDLLLHNNVRYRQFPEEEIFFTTLQREPDSYYNGHDIFVVSHKQDYFLRVFVDKSTFGIIRIEYENLQEAPINKRKGLFSKFVGLKKVIDFRLFDGKLFLNYISVDSKINWYDVKSNELRFETELNQQLLINKVNKQTEEWIGTTEKMRRYGLQYQDLPYNKNFWDTYNVIKESPLDRKIVQDLEKLGPLDKQFQEN